MARGRATGPRAWGSAISSFVGGAFNWSNTANWTGGTIADTYNFTGTLGGNAFTTGANNENSRFDITKTGTGTQKISGASLATGTTTINLTLYTAVETIGRAGK